MKRSYIFYLALAWLTGVAYTYEYQVSIAAIFQNEAPYFKEWIDYHRQIGVEHFWLYDDISSDDWKSVLQPYIDEGVVEVIDWSKCRENRQVWPKIQLQAYKDAMVRTSGVSKWVAFIDIDEFLLPMTQKSLIDCFEKHFTTADAIYASWVLFGTSGVSLQEGDSMLEKLTACCRNTHPWNRVGKSIVQPEKVLVDRIWYVHHFPLQEGCYYRDGDGRQMPWKSIGDPKDLKEEPVAGQHREKYLRINHYFFRDETFYREVKLARKLQRGFSVRELTRLYEQASLCQDRKIIEFIESLKSESSL